MIGPIRMLVAGPLAALVLGLGATTAMAAPGPVPEPTPSVSPAPSPTQAPSTGAVQGVDGMIPEPNIRDGNQPLLFERYSPLSYLNPWQVLLSFGTAITNPGSVPLYFTSSVLTGFGVLVGVLATRLIEWTFSMDAVSQFAGALDSMVHSLEQGLFAPLLAVALVLVGIGLAWQAARRRTMSAIGSALAAILVLGLAYVYFQQPAQIVETANQAVSDVTGAILASVAGANPSIHDRRSNPALAKGPTSDAEVREFADGFWREYVYDPWTIVQFGAVDPTVQGRQVGVELLQKESGQPSNFDSDLAQLPANEQSWYAGQDATGQVMVAGMLLLSVTVAAIMYLIVALMVAASQVGLLILAMLLPVLLLIGIPQGGRQVLIRAVEMGAGLLAMRVVWSLVLSVMLVVGGVVWRTGPFMGLLMELLVVIAAMIMRRPLYELFRQAGHVRIALPQAWEVPGGSVAEKVHTHLGSTRQRMLVPDRLDAPQWLPDPVRHMVAARRGGGALPAPSGAVGARATGSRVGAAALPARTAAAGGGTGAAGGAAAAGAWPLLALWAAEKTLKAGHGTMRWMQGQGRHLNAGAQPSSGPKQSPPLRLVQHVPAGARRVNGSPARQTGAAAPSPTPPAPLPPQTPSFVSGAAGLPTVRRVCPACNRRATHTERRDGFRCHGCGATHDAVGTISYPGAVQ